MSKKTFALINKPCWDSFQNVSTQVLHNVYDKQIDAALLNTNVSFAIVAIFAFKFPLPQGTEGVDTAADPRIYSPYLSNGNSTY